MHTTRWTAGRDSLSVHLPVSGGGEGGGGSGASGEDSGAAGCKGDRDEYVRCVQLQMPLNAPVSFIGYGFEGTSFWTHVIVHQLNVT